MYPAVLRLKRRADFLRVARTRRKWVTPGLILQARTRTVEDLSSGDIEVLRVGFTVSRKVGNAVVRNRVKRRLRDVASQVIGEQARAGHDFVIIGRAGALKRPFAALRCDLEKALKQVDAHGGAGGGRKSEDGLSR
jgi:ribonuclease P protein component